MGYLYCVPTVKSCHWTMFYGESLRWTKLCKVQGFRRLHSEICLVSFICMYCSCKLSDAYSKMHVSQWLGLLNPCNIYQLKKSLTLYINANNEIPQQSKELAHIWVKHQGRSCYFYETVNNISIQLIKFY